MENRNEISIRRRLSSMLVDHISMALLAAVIGIPVLIVDFFASWFFDFYLEWIMGVFITFIYLNKDFFRAKSMGKRMFGLKVMQDDCDEEATRSQCFIRNLTIFIWPIEVYFTFLSTEKRLGDQFAGTRVVNDSKEDVLGVVDEFKQEFNIND